MAKSEKVKDWIKWRYALCHESSLHDLCFWRLKREFEGVESGGELGQVEGQKVEEEEPKVFSEKEIEKALKGFRKSGEFSTG